MIKASYNDKERVVQILTAAFDDNKSVNYIIGRDSHRKKRMMRLMQYAFDVCYYFGMVFLSDDKNGCVLIALPGKKKTSWRSVWLDGKLVGGLGLSQVVKAIRRESMIKKLHPGGPMFYLWFIGVDPASQKHGTGSRLLSEVIELSKKDKKIICLETSTIKNLPWYQLYGFKLYGELDFGYTLYFLKTQP